MKLLDNRHVQKILKDRQYIQRSSDRHTKIERSTYKDRPKDIQKYNKGQ